MLLQLSAVIVAVAFVILTFFLVQTLKSLKVSLDEITLAMEQTKNEVKEIGDEIKQVIKNTNEMAVDLRVKLSKLNHWFGTVNDAGQVIHEITASVKQYAASLAASMKRTGSVKGETAQNGRWQAILSGFAVSLEMWQKLRQKPKQARTTGNAD